MFTVGRIFFQSIEFLNEELFRICDKDLEI
jgi:hypothetical protein